MRKWWGDIWGRGHDHQRIRNFHRCRLRLCSLVVFLMNQPVMTNEERAKAIAAAANECCHRSDGFEAAIEALALEHIYAAINEFWAQQP